MPIDEKDIARLREIFVTRQECQAQTDSFETKLNKDLVRLAVIETKLSQITWILSTVAAGVVTMLIKMFFGS
jgi:hypothetical protein